MHRNGAAEALLIGAGAILRYPECGEVKSLSNLISTFPVLPEKVWKAHAGPKLHNNMEYSARRPKTAIQPLAGPARLAGFLPTHRAVGPS